MNLVIMIIGLAILAETTYLIYVEQKGEPYRSRGDRNIYVDTSALIDERVREVAKTGFLSGNLIIPKSVTRELQLLADGKDAEKRKRARNGLNAVNEIERIVFFDTSILDDSDLGRMPVDDRLLKLAKENHGAILTSDYNLCKVAETENIEVLNVNDLAIALDNKYNVGDRLRLRITERGQNAGPGVGHLEDGTMVVVDNTANMIDKEVDIELTHFHQTPAGKMIFAKLTNKRPKFSGSKAR